SPGFQSAQQPAQQAFSTQQQALLLGTVQGSTLANGQATLFHRAFNTMTLRDPTGANWNMDTGATGDLYPVTSPSYPQAFLVGQQTWHQRLGHPGSEVLRHLVSNNLISCNKTKSTVLCHACQLGKHVQLPFSLSEIVVKSPFDIIHSNLWTSPLSSVTEMWDLWTYLILFCSSVKFPKF
ncbi:ribonuclease H-like domain-containing protein, partial [Tanacetum coccineum]